MIGVPKRVSQYDREPEVFRLRRSLFPTLSAHTVRNSHHFAKSGAEKKLVDFFS